VWDKITFMVAIVSLVNAESTPSGFRANASPT